MSWYLAGVARPVGVGIIFVALLREQLALYRQARGRLRDLEQLHHAGHALVTRLHGDEVPRTIAAKGRTIAQADAGVLFRLDGRSQVLRPVAVSGAPGLEMQGPDLPVGQGASGLAVLKRRPVWSSNVHADPALWLPISAAAALAREHLTAVLAVPLLDQDGEMFGTLSVLYREPRTFDETDVERLSAFGTQASVALENARAFDRLALRARHDAALEEFARYLLQATVEAEIYDGAMAFTQRLLGVDSVALFLLSAPGRFHVAAARGVRPGAIDASEMFLTCTQADRKMVEVVDFTTEGRCPVPAYVVDHGLRAGIMLPLGVREPPVGVLAAYSRAPRRFTDEEKRALASLAHQIALALDKVRLYAELRENLQRLQDTQAQLMQADKLRALGTLLSGMAHELNNPLSTIHLSVHLMKRQGALSPALQERLEVIERAEVRAARIVRDLLVFARRQTPERRRVNPNEIVDLALNLHFPDLELKRIHVIRMLDAVPAIRADAHQLQQVFLNLFTNAMDAMTAAHGERVLRVRSTRRGAEVVVEVEDSGSGIAPEHLGRIFEPFFTTKGAGAGTGLGLSLSIGIVEAHGGRMEVENVPGAGARFRVVLPIEEEDEESEVPTVAEPGPPAVAGADVLIVEDEAPLRGLLVEAMRHMGHEVVEATTGEEALARLRERTYDIVMLDLRLPDLDGPAVWQRALADHPELSTRFVFMTGDIISAEIQRFLDRTGRPFLIKPFNMEQVQEALGAVRATSG